MHRAPLSPKWLYTSQPQRDGQKAHYLPLRARSVAMSSLVVRTLME